MNKDDLEIDISTALKNWDEQSMFSLAGVNNLSRSDLDVLSLCCDFYDQHGSLNGLKYFSPEIKKVLGIYGLL